MAGSPSIPSILGIVYSKDHPYYYMMGRHTCLYPLLDDTSKNVEVNFVFSRKEHYEEHMSKELPSHLQYVTTYSLMDRRIRPCTCLDCESMLQYNRDHRPPPMDISMTVFGIQ